MQQEKMEQKFSSSINLPAAFNFSGVAGRGGTGGFMWLL
jgi:hypothetical protein